ncbi:hypothetical protein BO71DRAFT_325373 [Aspergillus ellipticus CBS 707.79]|uniref:Uncharacterized protein n=1 Tax=Aspergillus ellipticus CBS 707.79 TaxID=1448320 RepID=A0A319DK33_9EURO|nr:hypothetical protein BO71DRAFT_325373 [Aspergillus ellipticus CBS 707.79]
MTISIKPHTSKRSIEPGKTSSGEKIKFIQYLGTNRANFVVESTDGSVRLVSSASAGGKPAIEGAVSQGVPYISRSAVEIHDLKRNVGAGGTYGLTWVAVGEWDTSKNRLPFIIVGFYHIFQTQRIDVAISRSNLAKIRSPAEAERLIGEGITGCLNMTLRDALES